MAAKGVRVGDRVRVERTSYEGVVLKRTSITGHHELAVRTDSGLTHYFDPTLDDVLVTIIPPTFKTGQVWETPDGAYWFIRRAADVGFCAMPIGSDVACNSQTTFLQMLPGLIFPVAS